MKFIGNLMIWCFIATGLIAATSFYAWPIGTDAAADARFELGTTGDITPEYAKLLRAMTTSDGNVIAKADANLNPQTLDLLRTAGVERVVIKHPTGAYGTMFANWTGKWLFIGSALGLIFGGMLLKVAARREVDSADASDSPRSSPEQVAGSIRAAIADLRGLLASIEGRDEKQHAIIKALSEVQGELVPAFVESRAVLIARKGMGHYATVMDKFAATERQVNRSWSAAADGALEESIDALNAAAVLADTLAETLGISTT
jgi:hypothetical protein